MRTETPIQHYFSAPEGVLNWYEWGQPNDANPSLLLLHATGFHARCWDQVIAALPAGQHVVALDQRGHGLSYRPNEISDWCKTAEEVATFVQATFSRPIVAVGHSMGAYVTVWAAALLPAHFTRLLLVDPVILAPAQYDAGTQKVPVEPDAHPVSRRRNQWESADQMITHFSTRVPYASWQPAVLADYCRHGLVPAASGEGLELACPPRIEASAYLGADQTNPYAMAATISCPVTILRGRTGERSSPMDFSFSPTWPALASAFQHGTDMQWSDHTHFIPMEAPVRLARLIADWLTEPD